jgi:hypothetical protein
LIPDPFPKGLIPKQMEDDSDGVLVEESMGWECTAREQKRISEEYLAARPGDRLMAGF